MTLSCKTRKHWGCWSLGGFQKICFSTSHGVFIHRLLYHMKNNMNERDLTAPKKKTLVLWNLIIWGWSEWFSWQWQSGSVHIYIYIYMCFDLESWTGCGFLRKLIWPKHVNPLPLSVQNSGISKSDTGLASRLGYSSIVGENVFLRYSNIAR